MALRNLLVRVGADLSNFEQGMNKAGKKLQDFQSKVMGFKGGVAGALGGALAGIGTGMFVGQGVEDAIKYEALMGTLSETMGQSIHDFQDWQNQVGASMGFSKLQGAELGNTLSLNFKKIATSHEDLVNKTTKMMEVAGRIAIKRGMTMEEVSDRIRSAMNQEADGADELGVNVRIAAIQQSEAYKQMADGRPWDKLTENMRKTILYHHILEQTAKTLGEEFQDNTQLRMINFVASLKDVRLALGQAFLPILHTALPILTAFARAIERALQVTTQFFYSLFGYKGGVKQANKNTQAYASQSEAISGLGDASEEAGEKIKKAGAEAKRGIADFDEIHELPEPSKAGAGAGAGAKGGGLGEDMLGGDETLPLYEGLVNWMDVIGGKAEELGKKFRKWFKESEGIKDLIRGLENLYDGFEKIATSKSMKWLIKQFAEDLPAFFDDLSQIVGGFFSLLGGALEEVGYLLDGDFNNAWKGTEKMFKGAYDIFSGTVGLIFPNLSKAMDDFFKNKFNPAWESFKKAWIDGEKPIRTSIENIKQKLTIDLINGMISTSKKIKAEWDALPISWQNTVNLIGQKWRETVFNMPTWMQDALRRTQDGFNKTFMPMIDKAKNKISELVRAWNKMDVSFGEALVNSFKFIYNKGAGKINGLIDLINKMVKKLNDLPGISGIPKIDYKIPYLAKGGIVSSPTVAMIGEAGTEAVTPIDKLQGMITSAVVSAMQFNTGARSGGDIVLNLDGRAFARIVNPYLDVEQKRIGANVRLNPI